MEKSDRVSHKGEASDSSTARAVSSQVASAANQLKQEVAGKAGQIRHKAEAAGEEQKQRVAREAEGLAQALHKTSGELAQEHGAVGQYTDTVASQIDRFAEFLRQRDLVAMARDIEMFARRQPALFLGGAFTAGLVAARFMKSSSAQASTSRESNRPSGEEHSTTAQERREPGLAEGYGPVPKGYGPTAAPVGGQSAQGSYGSEGGGGIDAVR